MKRVHRYSILRTVKVVQCKFYGAVAFVWDTTDISLCCFLTRNPSRIPSIQRVNLFASSSSRFVCGSPTARVLPQGMFLLWSPGRVPTPSEGAWVPTHPVYSKDWEDPLQTTICVTGDFKESTLFHSPNLPYSKGIGEVWWMNCSTLLILSTRLKKHGTHAMDFLVSPVTKVVVCRGSSSK